MQNKAISRRHATFFTQNNKWAIVDHQSTNGVFLNGKRLESPCWLENYDVVRITDTYFIFKDNELIFSSGILNKKEELSYDPEAPVYNNPYPHTPPAPPYENFNTPKPSNKTQLVINISERSVFQRFKKILLLQDINLTVSEEVISTIVEKTVMSIPGIYDINGGIIDGITNMLGTKRVKGIKVDISEKSISIDIYLIVEYGVKIPDVAWEIQGKTKNEVEAMTGLNVVAVNVNIEGVDTAATEDEQPVATEKTKDETTEE
jgi:uncharacterized alkaline shock family protein YloU